MPSGAWRARGASCRDRGRARQGRGTRSLLDDEHLGSQAEGGVEVGGGQIRAREPVAQAVVHEPAPYERHRWSTDVPGAIGCRRRCVRVSAMPAPGPVALGRR